MRNLIATALIAAVAMPAAIVPVAASAQSRGELRRDRQDIRDERRDLDHALRHGDRRDVRDAREDLREAHREYREDLRDRDRRWGTDDWRRWRDRNRPLYARGRWNAPFRYTAFRPGVRIAPTYWSSSRYWIADPWRYHLPPAGRFQRWVRHYDDAVLVDYRRGYVVTVIRGFYW